MNNELDQMPSLLYGPCEAGKRNPKRGPTIETTAQMLGQIARKEMALDIDRYSEALKRPKFSREWAMPNKDTFSIPPIAYFVRRYLTDQHKCSLDPFAGSKQWATYTNDLNPRIHADYHMDAEAFLKFMAEKEVTADVALFDPPYSTRQISECYKSVGMEVGMKETQSALLYKRVRDALMPVLTPNAVVLSFGWNTVGMGIKRGFEIIEIMLVCHGGAHNDTICLAERRIDAELSL